MGFSFGGTKDIQGYFGLQSSSSDGRRAKYTNDNDYPVRIKSITFTAEAGASGYTFYWYGSSVTGGGKISGFQIQITNSDGKKVYATSNSCDIGGSITTYPQYDKSADTTWQRFNYSDVDQKPTFKFSNPPVIPAGTTVYIDLCSLRDSDVMSGKVLCFNKPNGTISGDVVPNSYNVTLDVNGGNTLSGWSPKSVTVGESITLPSATRSGHNFLNWNTKKDGTGTAYNTGTKYTPTGDITLYAIWQLKTYIITYDLNGGSGNFSAQIKYHDAVLNLHTHIPERYGYTFTHWSAKAEGATTAYSKDPTKPEQMYWSSNANGTMTAQWKLNNYTITYDANGGSGAPSNQIKTHGVNLTLSNTKPTRTGYTFLGWATSSTATTATYQPGASYTTNAALTLYAVWQANKVSIAYNPNGGKVSKAGYDYNDYGWITKNNETYFHEITYPNTGNPYNASTFGLEKKGYSFANWKVHSTGKILDENTDYPSSDYAQYNDSAKTTENTTSVYCYLYAQWEPITYSIIFDKNDTNENDLLYVDGTTASITDIKYDTSIELTANGYTAAGYTFKGWNTKANGSGISYINKQTVKNLTTENNKEIILYAQWEKNYYAGIKTNSGWKDSIMYIKVNNTWKVVDDTYIKPNSIWKEGKP